MKLIKIVRTIIIPEDELDFEQEDYWQYVNRSDTAIWFNGVTKTPVDLSEVSEEAKAFFEDQESDVC
jgi:hypothetical protein